ncbi:MAG TPA: DUF362 domain-containing protein [Candidatus Obscuribacterales bacterium]
MAQIDEKISRRTLIKAAATLALSGCSISAGKGDIEVSPDQRTSRVKGDSTVAILSVDSYEQDFSKSLTSLLSTMPVPSLKGKKVVIKPNMVDFNPGKPLCTDPAMIELAARVADALGAKEIVVAEGPGHFRDTEFLLETSGIGRQLKKTGLPFVDLNVDELEKVENRHGFTRLEYFYLPRTITDADVVISLPKLKTHHWVGVTASMKNFFGVVPGRKYGWPKNLLHIEGIGRSIIDVVRLMPPHLAIVDAIVAMEGDGPLNGSAKRSGFVAAGSDLAAVDATCTRAMGVDPFTLPYLRLAGEVIGNIDRANITVLGTTLESITRTFQMPAIYKDPALLKRAASGAS